MAAPLLLLDFARTRRFDRRLAFARPAPAWRPAAPGPLRAAAAGQPRLDGTGLLLEPAATNLVLHAMAFDQAGWTPSYTTLTPAVCPDGSLTAWTVRETATTRAFRLYQRYLTGEGLHTASIYAKAAERSVVRLRLNNTAGTATAAANLADGTLLADSVPGTTVTAVGDGWYRLTVSMALTGTDNQLFILLGRDTGPPTTYAGDPACGLHLWGAQIEAGSHASSPIATAGAAAARGPESVTLPLTRLPRAHLPDGPPDRGTLLVDVDLTGAASTPQTLAALSAGDGALRLRLPGDGTVTAAVSSGETESAVSLGPAAAGIRLRAALAWTPDGMAAGANGGAVTACDGTPPGGLGALHLGHADGAEHAGVRLRRVVLYGTRLPDAVLRRLTQG